MITILHSSLLPLIQETPVGILPICFSAEDCPALVVKVPKEFILAAKLNEKFKIYIVPVFIDNLHTIAAVTAFFDDDDEPLIIRTPLFAEDFAIDLFKVLKSNKINVHFFDELSRERLVYDATVSIPNLTKIQIEEFPLLDPSLPKAKAMLDLILDWFGQRTAEDDARAITVSLNRSIYGEDLFIQDMRPEKHSFHGSHGFSHTILEIEEPGSYQEEDIIKCLLSVFPSEQIFLNPKRIYDKEEMCDILIVTNTRVLILQAKDSPNIERISRQNLKRKRNSVMKSLKKAADQVKGAIRYYHRETNTLKFFIDEEQHSIDINGLALKSLIVVKELFNDQYNEYSPILLALVREKGVPCIVLDYPELYQYCVQLQGEESFFNAYSVVMEHAMKNNEYPRLRFGLVEESVVKPGAKS